MSENTELSATVEQLAAELDVLRAEVDELHGRYHRTTEPPLRITSLALDPCSKDLRINEVPTEKLEELRQEAVAEGKKQAMLFDRQQPYVIGPSPPPPEIKRTRLDRDELAGFNWPATRITEEQRKMLDIMANSTSNPLTQILADSVEQMWATFTELSVEQWLEEKRQLVAQRSTQDR